MELCVKILDWDCIGKLNVFTIVHNDVLGRQKDHNEKTEIRYN
jgi:hypothetical protein